MSRKSLTMNSSIRKNIKPSASDDKLKMLRERVILRRSEATMSQKVLKNA